MTDMLPILRMDRQKAIAVLTDSLYPGASPASVEMVLSYCEASGLDPLQKPVHIVPMTIEDKATGKEVKRDVVMPGIGLYRTQASRTGEYAGQSAPTFGPDKILQIDDYELIYPEWCEVTVFRLVGNEPRPFQARERWLENYATARGSRTPNKMWKRRPYAQLAKCAEAQALRRAFPELGSAPTADETVFDLSETAAPAPIMMPKAAAEGPFDDPPTQENERGPDDEQRSDQATPARQVPPAASPAQNPGNAAPSNAGLIAWITRKFNAFEFDDARRLELMKKHGFSSLDRATEDQLAALKSDLVRL